MSSCCDFFLFFIWMNAILLLLKIRERDRLDSFSFHADKPACAHIEEDILDAISLLTKLPRSQSIIIFFKPQNQINSTT